MNNKGGGFKIPFKKKTLSENIKELKNRVKKNSNLKYLLRKGIDVISDPEGSSITEMTYPTSKFNNDKSFNKNINDNTIAMNEHGDFNYTNKNIIVLGDVLDSTTPGDNPEFIRSKKKYNLRNLQLLYNGRKNSMLILGNRDLNKIKVHPLFKLENNNNNELIEQYNNGELELTRRNYELIKENMNFNIKTMNSWYPFWKMGEKPGKDWSEEKSYNNNNPFCKRFYEVFGKDTNKSDTNTGTMSAQNTLLGIYHEIFDIILTEKVKNNSYYKHYDINDFKAFCVCAVYMSLLNPTEKRDKYNFDNNNNTNNFKGLLSNILRRSLACGYIKNNSNIYTLSHGGLTRDFFRGGFSYFTKNFFDYENEEYNKEGDKKSELFTDYEKYKKYKNYNLKSTGGYYRNVDYSSSSYNIIKNIEDCNSTVSECIHKALYQNKDDIKKPSIEMLFLLAISSPFESKKFFGNNSGVDLEIQKIGPVMPRHNTVRENITLCSDIKTIYHLIGHTPAGYSPVLDYFSNENKDEFRDGWLINMDTSQSFTSTDKNNNSNARLNISEDGLCKITGNIRLKNIELKHISDDINNFSDFFDEDGKIKVEYNNNITGSKNLLDINTKYYDYYDDEEIKNLKMINENEKEYKKYYNIDFKSVKNPEKGGPRFLYDQEVSLFGDILGETIKEFGKDYHVLFVKTYEDKDNNIDTYIGFVITGNSYTKSLVILSQEDINRLKTEKN